MAIAFILSLGWIIQTLVGYWICMNSCANAYWPGADRRNDNGISNFNTIRDNGLFWNLLPIVGFLATYSFITDSGEVRWDAFTIRYVKSAW